jgi:hypothetical protein
VTTDYTDIVARFSDQLAAETLAKFIAAAGIPCGLVDVWDAVGLERYGVRVPRSRIGELKQVLKLTPVGKRLSDAAAQVMAGRLAREDIPCYVGGWHTFGGVWGTGSIGLDSLTTLKETKEPGEMVAVPASAFGKALHVLNQQPISEAELTELALRTAADPEDPI